MAKETDSDSAAEKRLEETQLVAIFERLKLVIPKGAAAMFFVGLPNAHFAFRSNMNNPQKEICLLLQLEHEFQAMPDCDNKPMLIEGAQLLLGMLIQSVKP